MHISSVHEGKKFRCPQYDYDFSFKSGLRLHIASVHKGKKPYKCQLCGTDYRNKSDLRVHNDRINENKRLTLVPFVTRLLKIKQL